MKNVAALYLERILRIASTFITTVLFARFLGLEGFGELSYSLSLIAVFTTLCSLGLDEILIRDAVKQGPLANTPAAAFLLRLVASLIIFPVAFLVLNITSQQSAYGIFFLVAIILLAPLYTIEQLLYADMRSRQLAIFGSVEICLTLCFRLFLIFSGAQEVWILFSYLLESSLRLTLITAYAWKEGISRILSHKVTKKSAAIALSEGMPLLVAGLAVLGYTKLDQIMLRTMVGAEEVGVYAVAVRITESFYFLPVILCSVLLPVLTSAKDSGNYNRLFDTLYRFSFYLGSAICFCIISFGNELVTIAFGTEYNESVTYLKIYALSIPLVFIGVASGKWLITEGLQKHSLYRTLAGLSVNILLNLLLIPRYGGTGAAIATLASQAMATFLYDFIFEQTRPMGLQKLNAALLRNTK